MSATYGDSPTRSRHTHSVEYRSTYVADSRRTLTRDIPAVPEVSLDTLMDAVLPTVPPDVLRRVCNLLHLQPGFYSGRAFQSLQSLQNVVSDGFIQDAGSNSPRWACLPLDSTVAGAGENVVFRFLQNIADQIIALSMGHLSDTDLHLRINGNTVPLGSRHNLSRPDGYFQLGGPRTGTPDWGDIVMPMGFKNHFKKKNQIDDFSKVLWSMHHIMRNDPRRRYVHGLTCEDTNARLWFHDRSDVFASEAFDVNKDWKRLVHIFLSMLLATRRELGYDASMRIAPAQHQNSEPSYDIAIHNADNRTTTVYRTTGIISDVGADGMISRATRVWKVRKFENGQLVGPEHALKDVWVHKGRVAEDMLLGQIRRDQPEYADHFLTPLDSGYVPLDPSNPDVLDDTHHTLGRPRRLKPTGRKIATQDLPPSARSTLNQKASASKDSPKASVTRDSVGHSNDLPSSPQEGHRGPCRLSEHPRQHYRIVFKEVGIPIHELRKFTHIFAGIQGGFAGLHAIHLCNYVHRDVSSGNILLVPSPGNTDGGRGVIMDLEYAKAIDDNSAPYDVKTGTAAFMATEIALGRHHRLSTTTQPPEPDNSDDDIDSLVESAFPTGSIPKKSRPPPLRHNPLHDIESIWWLCVWMLFYLIHPEKGQKDGETQLQNYRRVFGTPESKLQFCDPDTFTLFTSHLSEEVSLLVHALMSWMGQIDRWFSRCYKRRDSPDSTMPLRIDSKTIKSSYDYGKRILDNLKRTSEQLPDYVELSEHYQGPDPNDVASLMESSLHIDNEGLPLPEDSSPLGGAE